MNGVGADVVHLEGCVPRQFALDPSRPGLNIGIERVFRFDHRDEGQRRRRERSQGVETGEHVIAELGRRWIGCEVQAVTDAVGIDVGRVVDLAPSAESKKIP